MTKQQRTKRIKVVISERTIRTWPHQVMLVEFHTIKLLKDAGMPINGFSKLHDVSVGKLTIWRELDLDDELEYHYEWVGPELVTPTVQVSATYDDEDDEL